MSTSIAVLNVAFGNVMSMRPPVWPFQCMALGLTVWSKVSMWMKSSSYLTDSICTLLKIRWSLSSLEKKKKKTLKAQDSITTLVGICAAAGTPVYRVHSQISALISTIQINVSVEQNKRHHKRVWLRTMTTFPDFSLPISQSWRHVSLRTNKIQHGGHHIVSSFCKRSI